MSRKRVGMVAALSVSLLTLGGPGIGNAQDDSIPMNIPLLAEDEMRNIGPNGEDSTPAEEVSLSDAEKEQVRSGGHKAALIWYTDAPFFRALTAGARDAFADLGVEVVAETNYELDPARMKNDVETVMALEPDILLSITLDPASGAEAYRPFLESGGTLAMLSTLPQGYVAGEDHIAIATGDHYAMGKGAAELLAESIGGEGKVGLIYHDADFYVTNRRDRVLKTTLVNEYPGIEIVDEQGMVDPAKGEEIATAMLTRNPDIKAIYAAWDTVAEGVVAGLRAAGREDVKVVTIDLGANMALDMIQDGPVYGMTAEKTYEMGQKLATLGAYGIIDKEAPPFVVIPALKITKDNVTEAWGEIFNADLPTELQEALNE